MDAIILRSIERLLGVVIGGVSIYLGYRLLLAMPTRKEGEGKVVLPGGISIYITRVGPGAFFALFGVTVVALSFLRSVTYTDGLGSNFHSSTGGGEAHVAYTGFGAPDSDRDLQLTRLQVATDIKFLNDRLQSLLAEKGSNQQDRTDLEALRPRLKLAMIKTVWGPDWGEFAKFKEWVLSGAPEPIPDDLLKPATLYLHGDLKP